MASEQINEQRYVAAEKIRAVMQAELKRWSHDVLEPGIAEAIGTLVRECERRCMEKIEGAAMEFAFKGAWTDGHRYRKRNIVSLGGAVYYCSADITETRPGVGDDWLLLVPKPRDGRDGKDSKDFAPPEQRTVKTGRLSHDDIVVSRRP
jgi:hypothetical protein